MVKVLMNRAKLSEFKTDRLELRQMTPEEWQDFLDHVIAADECFLTFGSEKSDELLEEIKKPFYAQVVYYTIHLPKTDQMIGYVGYNVAIAHIEYYIFKDYRRLGYAYEAVASLMDKLLDGSLLGDPVGEIRAWIVLNNMPSEQLLLKLGFHETGLGLYYDNTIGRNFSYSKEEEEVSA